MIGGMQILNMKIENDKSKFKNEKKQTFNNANDFSGFVVRGYDFAF
jgi:hypothetical protein